MRNRRILRILPALGVGVLLLPLSSWATGGRQVDSEVAVAVEPTLAAAPPGSLPGSVEEDRLWAEARHESAAAVVTRRAEQAVARREAAKRAAAERARRQRASRSGARSPRPAPLVIAGAAGDVWAKLRRCEAGGNYRTNTGNGYYGAYQFAAATWRSLGYSGLPHQAAPEVQDEAARRLQRRSGWGQWPACSRRIGVR